MPDDTQTCVKCGSYGDLGVRYAPRKVSLSGLNPNPCLKDCPEGEHLHLRCKRCGYRTHRPCRDAKGAD